MPTHQNKKIILVTGCCGRIGTLTVERFAKEGYVVIGWDILEPQSKQYMDYYNVDLSSYQDVAKNLQIICEKYGDHLTSVIHLAAYYSFSGKHPELYEKITVQGTGRLLRGLQSFHVEQFIFSSTQLVYAPCKVGEKINENSPLDPKWDYPKSKVKTEKLMHAEHGHIPIVILRIAGCYDNECHSIPIAHQIQRIYENQLASHLYSGNITHGSPFLHLDDLIDCLWLCVEKRKDLPQELTLLIGEEKTMSYDEMQKEISKLINDTSIKTFQIPKWIAKIGAWILDRLPKSDAFIQPWMIDLADDHYSLDISKAKKVLGWEPKHFVGDILPIMILNLKKNSTRWYKENDLIK